MSRRILPLLVLALLSGCDVPSGSLPDGGLELPTSLSLRVSHTVLAAGDTLRLHLDSPDSLRRCLVAWDSDGVGDFLLPLNMDSMYWSRAAGSVSDPEIVTLRVCVSDGDQEWRDSVSVTVLEGWPGRVSWLPIHAQRLQAEGRIAVLATDSFESGIREAHVVDLSNARLPRLIATFPKDVGGGDLQLELPRLYLSCGFHIVDLQVPASPWEIGHVDTLGFECSAVVGNRVFGSRAGHLYRLDISDPAHWVVESILPDWMYWGGGYSLDWVDQTLVHVYDWDGDYYGGRVVKLIDMRNPDQPSAGGATSTSYNVSSGTLANQIGNVLLRDGWLYVPNGCLQVFRVDDERQLQLVAAPQDLRTAFVFEAGPDRLLCLAAEPWSFDWVLRLVDVQDPTRPTILREGSLPGDWIRDAARLGDFLLVLTSSGLQVLWAPIS